MNFKDSIFRDYDIRGVYPTELNDETALLIGKSLGTYLIDRHYSKVVVGRDNRPSSIFLCENFIKGLLSTGCEVTHIGISLTPVIHFLTCGDEFHCGVMVTASHNPKEFNGFRIDLQGATSLYGNELKKILTIIKTGKFKDGAGVYHEKNLNNKYIDYISDKFQFSKLLKVIVDCGGGASGEIASSIFEKNGIDSEILNKNYDSDFEKYVPDPENPVFVGELIAAVKEDKADIGICFDTDGDRVGFVDENGINYTTDLVLMLLAKYLLKDKPNSKIVFDVKSSDEVALQIRKFGGIPKMIRTGHPYFDEEIRLRGALLGAEYSGHMFIADDYYGYDDGIYAACRVIKLLEDTGIKFSTLMKEFPVKFSSPEIKVSCDDAKKFSIVEKIKIEVMNDSHCKNIITIDGIRANVSTFGWFLIRASNTNPYISIRMEAVSAEGLIEIKNYVTRLVVSHGLKVLPF